MPSPSERARAWPKLEKCSSLESEAVASIEGHFYTSKKESVKKEEKGDKRDDNV
jgi:hypothetical protein